MNLGNLTARNGQDIAGVFSSYFASVFIRYPSDAMFDEVQSISLHIDSCQLFDKQIFFGCQNR